MSNPCLIALPTHVGRKEGGNRDVGGVGGGFRPNFSTQAGGSGPACRVAPPPQGKGYLPFSQWRWQSKGRKSEKKLWTGGPEEKAIHFCPKVSPGKEKGRVQNKYSLNQGYFPFTFVYQAEWPDEIMAFFSGVTSWKRKCFATFYQIRRSLLFLNKI